MRRRVMKIFPAFLLGLGAVAPVWAQSQAASSETGLPPVAESRVMHESFWYSSYADRAWVVGYGPKTTSLFLNPREYPSAVQAPVVWKTVYRGTLAAFCRSTSGQPTFGMEAGSPARAYHYGQLGITSKLASGYPEGKRVVEPVIVPHPSSSRRGGVLIVGAPTTLSFAPECRTKNKQPSSLPLEK
ncbi:MAG: hypothetical protein N2Z21_11350 [Candidatus Sumerlaeaceae bacterium]|nr:hypothetical protein [Candidatus Sumerlaeaceae bacterium]